MAEKQHKMTYTEVVRAWQLAEHGVPTSIIAETLGRSQGHIGRIKRIFTLVRDGKINDARTTESTKRDHLVAMACRYFGKAMPLEEITPPHEQIEAVLEETHDGTKEPLIGMSYELTQIRKLLERLCEAWGADNNN